MKKKNYHPKVQVFKKGLINLKKYIPLVSTILSKRQNKWEIYSDFVAFLQFINLPYYIFILVVIKLSRKVWYSISTLVSPDSWTRMLLTLKEKMWLFLLEILSLLQTVVLQLQCWHLARKRSRILPFSLKMKNLKKRRMIRYWFWLFPPKILPKKFVKLIGHCYACNSLTNFYYEAHAITGNGNLVNLMKLAWINSWNHIKWSYFWRVWAICVNPVGFWLSIYELI